jgi:hypothetical protein
METAFSSLIGINLFKDVLIPLAAAVFGLWFATRKFRSEQIWKDKYLAYQKVIQSLESISHWASEIVSTMNMLPSAGTPNIAVEYKAAQREVLRQSTIGSLLLSKAFLEELDTFSTVFFGQQTAWAENHHDDPQEEEISWGHYASKVHSLVSLHLPKLIELARCDLRS